MKMIVGLVDIHGNEKGVKAGRLAELSRKGLPVPPTCVYSIAHNLPHKEIFTECSSLLEKPFIVRSSANVEDGKTASFAGIFESIYPISTLAQFVKAFKKIELSLQSEKLKSYAQENNILLESIEMHLIIQEYKKASMSGVLFTESPLNKNNILIEYTSAPGGVTDGALPVERLELARDDTSPEKFQELIGYALDAEKLFGVPQDIEWVVAEDGVWIVQSRDITRGGVEVDIKSEMKRLAEKFGDKPPAFVRKAFAEGMQRISQYELESFQKFYSQTGAYGRVMKKFGIQLRPFDPTLYAVSIFGQPFLNETLEKEFMPFALDDSPIKVLFSGKSLSKFFSLIYVQSMVRIKLYWEYRTLEQRLLVEKEFIQNIEMKEVPELVTLLDTQVVPRLFTYALFQDYLHLFLRDRVKKYIQENEWNHFLANSNRESVISRFPDTWSKQIISFHAEMYDKYSGARETLHKIFVEVFEKSKSLENPENSYKVFPRISLPARIDISSWDELLKPRKIEKGDMEGEILSYGFAEGVLGTLAMLKEGKKVDILIHPTIDPMLVEYFPQIKAVITEMGGELSHAAILAREYGIPMLKIEKDLSGYISKEASISGKLLHFS